MADSEIDLDLGTKMHAFTTKNYRDVYPGIDPTRPEHSQSGKVVVITGASRGLGRLSFATSFAQAGAAAIVLIGRSENGLIETEKVVTEINPNIKVLRIPLDITDEPAVDNAFKDIVAQVGVPHVLINNAAIMPLATTVESSLDSWWGCQEINIKGTFIVTKAFIKQTGPNPSSPTTILTLTSLSSLGVPPEMGAYALSKLAVTKMMAYVASEHPAITTASLDPGIVATDMNDGVEFLAPYRLDLPALVGGTAVWMASGDKKFMSGRYICANWDVEEIERRKDEIVELDSLKYRVTGNFAKNATVEGSKK